MRLTRRQHARSKNHVVLVEMLNVHALRRHRGKPVAHACSASQQPIPFQCTGLTRRVWARKVAYGCDIRTISLGTNARVSGCQARVPTSYPQPRRSDLGQNNRELVDLISAKVGTSFLHPASVHRRGFPAVTTAQRKGAHSSAHSRPHAPVDGLWGARKPELFFVLDEVLAQQLESARPQFGLRDHHVVGENER